VFKPFRQMANQTALASNAPPRQAASPLRIVGPAHYIWSS
jgi:hypothetical protein